jgi:benzoylformate decarboxylase
VQTAPVTLREVSRRIAPDPALIDAAARALDAAQRPALVIGPDVDQDGAGDAAVALAERLRAPVWSAPFSCRVSFPEEHPLFAGFLASAPDMVSAALSGYDCILVLGAPVFTFHVGGDCPLFRSGVPLFQITTDADAIACAGMGTGIVGSLDLAVPAITALVHPATERPMPPRRPQPAPPAASSPILAEYLMHTLSQTMPEDAVVVEEMPSHRPAMQAYLPMRRWGSFYTMASGGLGYSLPAAVGVALAQPDRPVVCLIGDGSMMYSVQALWTAVQHGLKLTVVVVNNGGYGAMRSFSRVMRVQNVPGIDLPGLDFAGLAAAMGCPGVRVSTPHDLAVRLQAAFQAQGPQLLEVVVDPAIPHLYNET